MKKSAVVIFTYKGDKDILPLCVRAVLKSLPNSPVYVVSDKAAPVPDTIRDEIIKLSSNVKWTESSFSRGGNLRGTECVQGMVRTMHAIAQHAGLGTNDCVVKLDTDVLLLGANWLQEFFSLDVGFAASVRLGELYSGICYCLKTWLLERMNNSVRSLELDRMACEDVAIGSLASACSSPRGFLSILPQSPTNKGGRWTAYDYTRSIPADFWASAFDVITFGNHSFCNLPPSVREEPMRKILSLRFP